jgi:hypothetical protein
MILRAEVRMGRTLPVIVLFAVSAFVVAVALYLAIAQPVDAFDADAIRAVTAMRR